MTPADEPLQVTVVRVPSLKVSTVHTERSPLMARPEEEVYPLPWFRSPEWTRRPRGRGQKQRRRGSYANVGSSAKSSSRWCCCVGGGVDAGETESETEQGYLARSGRSSMSGDEDTDSFKQCIQFLVGLIVIMAMALILLIIFQPQMRETP